MAELRYDNVTSLTEEKYTALSEENGWSLAFAEGLVEGQIERRRGNKASSYVIVGTDDYALGFRAGYFKRGNPDRGARLWSGRFGVEMNGEMRREG